MALVVLEVKDLTTPLFLVRTWEIVSSCITFSLVSSLDPSNQKLNFSGLYHKPTSNPFWVYCMFTWCSFFILTLLIHILSLFQFHSLLPLSWKNLTVTVATLGALMSLSSALIFLLLVMDRYKVSAHSVAAAALAFLTFLAYASEAIILCRQPPENRGYMGSMSGLLKVIQLWGCCQMIPLMINLIGELHAKSVPWQLWVALVTWGLCFLMCVVTLVVILGDWAGRCPLHFGKCIIAFILNGMLLSIITTVILYTQIQQLIKDGHSVYERRIKLIIMETIVASLLLMAYTVDFALAIKLMCDRGHS